MRDGLSRSRPRLYRRTMAAVAIVCCLAAPATLQAQPKNPPPKKYALLVGCTEYQHCKWIDPLDGPANDVPRFASVLEALDFPKANITRLLGWSLDASKSRPSYDNIVKGFEDLVKKADVDTQIVILLSGHGVQVPIPETREVPLDPRNPKLDGMDKVFLPADVKEWRDGKLENALLDNQIGRYLEQMALKGAAVWIVLDCCHSGTMARSADKDDVERMREVRLRDLKIPDQAIEDAARRAIEAFKKLPAGGEKLRSPDVPGMLTLPSRQGGKGSVVAFYACLPYEKAPELPRPAGEAAVKKNYYGLLSYTLTSILRSHPKTKMTYRELAQTIVASYQSERGGRSPTAFAEGDLDREVLGMTVWPKRAHLILEQTDDKWHVSGSGVFGLTRGSILAVHPPADAPRDFKDVLGYLKVTGLTPFHAVVEPCTHEKPPAVPADRLPARARCKVVLKDLGEMRLKLAIGKGTNTGGKPIDPAEAKRRQNLTAALALLPAETKTLLVTEDQGKADWILWLAGNQVQLRAGDGRSTIDPGEDLLVQKVASQGKPLTRMIFGKYDADNPTTIAEGLERDLQKIFTWRNVWRVAGCVGSKENDAPDLKLEVLKMKDKVTPDGTLEPGTPVRPGQRIEARIRNDSNEDLWVTVLFLDANAGIRLAFSDSIQARRSLKKPIGGMISKTSYGKEGFVVLAVPVTLHRERPDFSFLEQTALGKEEVSERGVRLRKASDIPQTPFEQLMTATAFGTGKIRGFDPDVPTNPTIVSWSWTTLPASSSAPEPK